MSPDNRRVIKSNDDTFAKFSRNFIATNFEVEATTLTENAKKEAAELIQKVNLEVGKIKEDAFNQGMAEGFKKGEAEGFQEGQKEGFKSGENKAYSERAEETQKALGRQTQALTDIMRFFEINHEKIVRQANAELLNLSMAVAEKVILAHLQQDRELVRRNVEEAITLCGRCTEVEVRTNPELLDMLESYVPEFKKNFEGLNQVHLIGDTSLEPGDTVIRTNETEIKGLVLEKLREIYRALFFQPGENMEELDVFPPIETLKADFSVKPPEKEEEKNNTSEILPQTTDKTPERLENTPKPASLATLIQDESDHIAAIFLAQMSPSLSGEVLKILPEQRQMNIIARLATLSTPDPKSLNEVDERLKFRMIDIQDMLSLPEMSPERLQNNPESLAADILRELESIQKEEILAAIGREDQGLVEKIKELI